ncbi:hypothetical protein WA026_000311 [Henosepilachna vigintioctopunctata]|uniref:2-phosphoxylose phosphatase 1 n=1 Tax=Henosepilachna vigintioctopunctata TaxID=420089 RepID=A0AAW1V7Y7_9CUCU
MTLDLTRMTLPNRALHCYILMSIWILLLVAGVYKFLETRETIPEPTVTAELFQSLAIDVKTKRIFKICNFPNELIAGDEGIVNSNRWNLKGLIFLVRHGDRGPLQYVRNISAVNCAGTPSESLNSYKKYLQNLTTFEKIFWATPGSFHGFPLLPIHPTECQLGQLTMQGIHQHLVLGKILRDSYIDVWQKLKNLTYHDVLVYSTRYRRTFQSALAFLRSFLPHETLTKISILESQSMNFCFKDCGCPATEKLTKSVLKWLSQQLKSHPAVAILSESTGRSIFSPGAEQGSFGSDPHSVRDALLTYICHGGNLPCETPFNCIK